MTLPRPTQPTPPAAFPSPRLEHIQNEVGAFVVRVAAPGARVVDRSRPRAAMTGSRPRLFADIEIVPCPIVDGNLAFLRIPVVQVVELHRSVEIVRVVYVRVVVEPPPIVRLADSRGLGARTGSGERRGNDRQEQKASQNASAHHDAFPPSMQVWLNSGRMLFGLRRGAVPARNSR